MGSSVSTVAVAFGFKSQRRGKCRQRTRRNQIPQIKSSETPQQGLLGQFRPTRGHLVIQTGQRQNAKSYGKKRTHSPRSARVAPARSGRGKIVARRGIVLSA